MMVTIVVLCPFGAYEIEIITEEIITHLARAYKTEAAEAIRYLSECGRSALAHDGISGRRPRCAVGEREHK
tara:strand:+ start:261 stop:473 length:213 start_codon:yes stop_codon:yes gene_type:complete